jgi:hypothetical protein
VRLHTILDKDKTSLFHNHPFNYISIILKGGYTEIFIEDGIEKTKKYSRFSIIKRSHKTFHRIDSIKSKTTTLFIAFGKYNWNAINTISDSENGVFQREINNKIVYAKKENGIWFIGNEDKDIAQKETRHSIHQV